jgi:hypothetical protein
MPTLKLDIDIDSLKRLSEIAVNERRPIPLQAEVLLLKAIGRWPVPDYLCREAGSHEAPQRLQEPTQ